MGHDVHFLDRLRRVSPAEADLALGLYRNVELVELLLAEAKVPVDAPRLAVALSDAAEPPYIVLARDGGFVTCLGAGMAPRNLPVVPFRFLASTAGRLDRILTKARAYRALAQSLGPFRNAYDRIYTHGDELTREEAVAFMSVTLVAKQHTLTGQHLAAYVEGGASGNEPKLAAAKESGKKRAR